MKYYWLFDVINKFVFFFCYSLLSIKLKQRLNKLFNNVTSLNFSFDCKDYFTFEGRTEYLVVTRGEIQNSHDTLPCGNITSNSGQFKDLGSLVTVITDVKLALNG